MRNGPPVHYMQLNTTSFVDFLEAAACGTGLKPSLNLYELVEQPEPKSAGARTAGTSGSLGIYAIRFNLQVSPPYAF